MHIIWCFLPVPILAFSESTRVLITNHSADIYKVMQIRYSAFVIRRIIILIWMVLLLFWRDFAGLLNSNTEIVDFSEKAMAIFIVPYILLALNLVIGSIFYRVGETQ
jgi:Na+-driven multidrug efflux pump